MHAHVGFFDTYLVLTLEPFALLIQTFPDEILDLDRSVRTLDLTHNRIGMHFFLCFISFSLHCG